MAAAIGSATTICGADLSAFAGCELRKLTGPQLDDIVAGLICSHDSGKAAGASLPGRLSEWRPARKTNPEG